MNEASRSPRLHYRRLGDGGAVFDSRNWQTRILSPAAAVIFEALSEAGGGSPLPRSEALALLRNELEVDTDTAEMREVLRSLREMGMLGE
ncbi:MAG: hypothetical protein H6942_14895 [Candidatus Accumulibacter sp.]|uniref:hypothetical protein n=1 Tax=Accumulibacter sp. TaxID=2053492 RepID=UPI0025CE3C71|nr:hypothetical protein [Accumulibacter sp.]MCP5249798.1 hypothetical protein [Accumulibacter sp.]